jgi:hypothetical protein
MLKRWGKPRGKPRAGVALLGLVLFFTFTPNANAASQSFSDDTMRFGGTAAEINASSSSAVLTPAPAVQELSSGGSGKINFNADKALCRGVGLYCDIGDGCQCVTVIASVTDGVGPLFSGSFVFYLNVDSAPAARQYNDGNNSGQKCFFATGILAETPASNSTINFLTSGAACNGIEKASGIYSGGFVIGPSTGGFSNASGSGILGFGANSSTKIGVFDLKGAAWDIN